MTPPRPCSQALLGNTLIARLRLAETEPGNTLTAKLSLVEAEPLKHCVPRQSLGTRRKLELLPAGFRFPNLFLLPRGLFLSPPPPVPPPPDPPKKWSADDTRQLLRGMALAVEALDLELKGMDANGGEAGCRYSEIVTQEEYKSAKCQNHFEKGTKAGARLEIRPVKGKGFSEIYRFHVIYDKPPGRLGIQAGGFYLTHPLNQDAEGPLDVEQEDPFEEGKDFRKAVRPSFRVPIGESVGYSDKATRLLMRVQGWIYDDFPLASFGLTKNMLLANGLTEEKSYRDLGIEPFKFPRRIDQFFDLFSQADTCYTKRPGASVLQPNFLKDLPPLIQWTAPEALDLDLRLRAKKIPLGPFGFLELGPGSGNKLQIRGDNKKTIVEITIADLKELQLARGESKFSAAGVKAGKIRLTLPPLAEIAKEMGWLDRKSSQEIIDACLGKASEASPQIDRSAYFQKIFKEISMSDLRADTLEFRYGDLETQIRFGSIQSLSLEPFEEEPKFIAKGLKAAEISFRKASARLNIESVEVQKVSLELKGSRPVFFLEDAKSRGTMSFVSPTGGPELKTKGKSQVKSFQLALDSDDTGERRLKGELKFSGTVEEFAWQHPQIGNLTLVDTEVGESALSFEVGIPRDRSTPLKPKFSLTVPTPMAKIQGGHLYFVEIGDSTLESGKISLSGRGDETEGLIEGKLDLKIQQVDIPKIEALLKGFRLEGSLKEIRIGGTGRLDLTSKDVQLNKVASENGLSPLSILGKFEPLRFQDTPAERDSKLRGKLTGKVVHTDMTIDSANLEVRDLESLHFLRGNKAEGVKPELKKLVVSDFAITDIQARGKLWAKFPIFGWLMGKFPRIGSLLSQDGKETYSSEIRFDSFRTLSDSEGRNTELNNFSFRILEVGGRKQMARFRLPRLTITKGKIETGKDPIELEMYFKDKDRGGDIRFELKDEDLTQRRRRRANK